MKSSKFQDFDINICLKCGKSPLTIINAVCLVLSLCPVLTPGYLLAMEDNKVMTDVKGAGLFTPYEVLMENLYFA